jgi:hypothetical protein
MPGSLILETRDPKKRSSRKIGMSTQQITGIAGIDSSNLLSRRKRDHFIDLPM